MDTEPTADTTDLLCVTDAGAGEAALRKLRPPRPENLKND